MPTLQVPVLLKDRDVEAAGQFPPFEMRTIEVESILPGPVSDRVAIIDLRQNAALVEALPAPTSEVAFDPSSLAEPYRDLEAIKWSTFGTVLETLALFEDEGCLGRKIPWAFDRPQLLVVPDAGDAANAFYHRESHSLQFFSYLGDDGLRSHASASLDVVAHETGHAILDGIAPWLYDASTPQSLAIHESIADLTALFAAASSRSLVTHAIEAANGDLEETWLFSSIARELGRGVGRAGDLRSLVDPNPERPETVGALELADPHDLSVVLSRAFYALFLDIYEARLDAPLPKRKASGANRLRELTEQKGSDEDSAADTGGSERRRQYRAAAFAVQVVKRLLFRGLDYLPPADVGFNGLARAVLACDRAAHPEDTNGIRTLLEARLLERGIGPPLETPFEGVRAALGTVDLDAIRESDWQAMRLVESHRTVLGLPDGLAFDVRPRVAVHKRLYRGKKQIFRDEVVLKVTWRSREAAAPTIGLPNERWVREGLTIAFDTRTAQVCGFVRADVGDHLRARDHWVARLQANHQLAPRRGSELNIEPRDPVRWVERDGAYELRGSARALHLLAGGGE